MIERIQEELKKYNRIPLVAWIKSQSKNRLSLIQAKDACDKLLIAMGFGYDAGNGFEWYREATSFDVQVNRWYDPVDNHCYKEWAPGRTNAVIEI